MQFVYLIFAYVNSKLIKRMIDRLLSKDSVRSASNFQTGGAREESKFLPFGLRSFEPLTYKQLISQGVVGGQATWQAF